MKSANKFYFIAAMNVYVHLCKRRESSFPISCDVLRFKMQTALNQRGVCCCSFIFFWAAAPLCLHSQQQSPPAHLHFSAVYIFYRHQGCAARTFSGSCSTKMRCEIPIKTRAVSAALMSQLRPPSVLCKFPKYC